MSEYTAKSEDKGEYRTRRTDSGLPAVRWTDEKLAEKEAATYARMPWTLEEVRDVINELLAERQRYSQLLTSLGELRAVLKLAAGTIKRGKKVLNRLEWETGQTDAEWISETAGVLVQLGAGVSTIDKLLVEPKPNSEPRHLEPKVTITRHDEELADPGDSTPASGERGERIITSLHCDNGDHIKCFWTGRGEHEYRERTSRCRCACHSQASKRGESGK